MTVKSGTGNMALLCDLENIAMGVRDPGMKLLISRECRSVSFARSKNREEKT